MVRPREPATAPGETAARDSALPHEREHIAALAALGDAYDSRRDELERATLATFDENIGVVDAAIASTRAATLANPSDEDLKAMLEHAGALGHGGPFKLTSHSGNVELRLPENAEGAFELSTFSGSIETDLGGVVERGRKPGEKLRVDRGAGGPDVRVRTFSGNITVRLGENG
jgi:hypothetical protein